jgi:hypothetical protein
MSSQRWYVAVLVASSRIDAVPAHVPVVDLQYRLIRASDNEDAYQRALQLGRQLAHSYQNFQGCAVAWECTGLRDLREIDEGELADGTEVYSQIVRDNPEQLVVPKEQLTCFWAAANKDKTAGEILDEENRTGEPRG